MQDMINGMMLTRGCIVKRWKRRGSFWGQVGGFVTSFVVIWVGSRVIRGGHSLPRPTGNYCSLSFTVASASLLKKGCRWESQPHSLGCSIQHYCIRQPQMGPAKNGAAAPAPCPPLRGILRLSSNYVQVMMKSQNLQSSLRPPNLPNLHSCN